MENTEKETVQSESVFKKLSWLRDIKDKMIRRRLLELDIPIKLAYTDYIYHKASIDELAERYGVNKGRIVYWILMVAYIVGGGEYTFGKGIWIDRYAWSTLYGRFPKAYKGSRCDKCVWSDTGTGRLICFRGCFDYSEYQEKTEGVIK